MCTPSHTVQLTTFRGHPIILQCPHHPHATPLAAATPILNPHSSLHGPSYSTTSHGGGSGGDGDNDDDDDDGVDNPGHPSDRPSGWDSFNRGHFPTPGGVNSILRNRASHPPTLEPDWRQITVDFDCDAVDPVTNLPYFWCAEHLYHGIVACFPVATDMHNVNKEIFRATLATGRFNSMMQKRFECNFPSYTSGMSMYTYISRIICHGLLCKFYVPPLHTIHYNDVYGAWASEPNFLPPHVCTNICSTMSSVLADCLQSKRANLVLVNEYGTIVCKNSDGYMSIFELASYAGHPHLIAYPKTIMMHVQQSDISLEDHILE